MSIHTPRLISVLTIRDGWHVQSMNFSAYLPVGEAGHSALEFDRWGIDEIALVFLNGSSRSNLEVISQVAGRVAVPLTVFGSVRDITDADLYLSAGADKVGVNRLFTDQPENAIAIAEKYGNQCLVASVDIVRRDGKLLRYDHWRRQASRVEIDDWIRKLQRWGAGEIFINFPEQDGTLSGMDVATVSHIVKTTEVPVIACGGVGNAAHVTECWREAGPSAVAVGNIFSYFEQSVLVIKEHLRRNGAPVRQSVKADCTRHRFTGDSRILKQEEAVLDDLLFTRIEPEVL